MMMFTISASGKESDMFERGLEAAYKVVVLRELMWRTPVQGTNSQNNQTHQ